MKITPDLMGMNVTEAIVLPRETRSRVFNDILEMGFRSLRIEIPWLLVEPAKGAYVWAETDALMADIPSEFTCIDIIVTHPPTWWNWIWPVTPSAQDFGKLMYQLARRYGDSGRVAFEIWNEPNLHAFWKDGNPATFTEHLKEGYKAVKIVNSQIPVILGGLAAAVTHTGIIPNPLLWFTNGLWFTNRDPAEFLNGVYAAGGKGYFDAVAYHPYSLTPDFKSVRPYENGVPNQFLEKISALQLVMESFGDRKSIWCNEFGYATSHWTEDEVIDNFDDTLSFLELPEHDIVTRAMFYSMRDFRFSNEPYDPGNEQHNFGVTREDHSRKKTFNWFRDIMAGMP